MTAFVPEKGKNFKSTFLYENGYKANYIINEPTTINKSSTGMNNLRLFVSAKEVETIDGYAADQNINKSYPSDLNGYYQQKNQKTALEALYFLKSKNYKIPEVALKKGLNRVIENTGLRGRWEIILKNPLTLKVFNF